MFCSILRYDWRHGVSFQIRAKQEKTKDKELKSWNKFKIFLDSLDSWASFQTWGTIAAGGLLSLGQDVFQKFTFL